MVSATEIGLMVVFGAPEISTTLMIDLIYVPGRELAGMLAFRAEGSVKITAAVVLMIISVVLRFTA